MLYNPVASSVAYKPVVLPALSLSLVNDFRVLARGNAHSEPTLTRGNMYARLVKFIKLQPLAVINVQIRYMKRIALVFLSLSLIDVVEKLVLRKAGAILYKGSVLKMLLAEFVNRC